MPLNSSIYFLELIVDFMTSFGSEDSNIKQALKYCDLVRAQLIFAQSYIYDLLTLQ